MQIIIQVNEPSSVEAIEKFSKECWEKSEGNADYLAVLKESFVAKTGANIDDVQICEIAKDIPVFN